MREEAERLLHQAREMGVFARLRKKPKETLQGYLDQVCERNAGDDRDPAQTRGAQGL